MTSSPQVSQATLGEALSAVRRDSPLTHCITNIVVAQWTANVLLAAGAAPAMVDNAHESGLFAGICDGLLINLGTPYEDTVEAMGHAVTGAAAAGTPWVLDPVAVGGLPWRTEKAHHFLKVAAPAIIRGNASEILGLTGGRGGRGADSSDAPEAALDAARRLTTSYGCTVAVSGPVDHIIDQDRHITISNGHPWLTKVTGVGCALGALMAAFAAAVPDRLVAAAAATAALTVAADAAVERSRGPGSFSVELLDELTLLTPDRLTEHVRLD